MGPVIKKILAVLLAIMSLFLIIMGVQLTLLGGSFYYLIIGVAYLLAAS